MKNKKMIRFIGIVCWFLALFILIDGYQAKKAAKEEEQQTVVMEQVQESNEGVESTVIFPTE